MRCTAWAPRGNGSWSSFRATIQTPGALRQVSREEAGQRIFKDVDLYNVIAVLPGKTMPETQVWITGHYDSLNLGTPRTPPASTEAASAPGSGEGAPRSARPSR